jgi:hypothetical protein
MLAGLGVIFDYHTVDSMSEEEKLNHPILNFLSSFNSAHREAAYDKVARNFFGLGDFVPKTTAFRHPTHNTAHSAMEFMPGATHPSETSNSPIMKSYALSGDLHKLGLMNAILGNHDRHLGNFLVDKDKKLKMIDHGLTFDYYKVGGHSVPRYIHFINQQYPHLSLINEDVQSWLSGLNEDKMNQVLDSAHVPDKLKQVSLRRLKKAKELVLSGSMIHIDDVIRNLTDIKLTAPKKDGINKSEMDSVIDLHVNDILASAKSVGKAQLSNLAGRRSKTKGPLHVWQLEDGRHLLVDGHHRFAEGIRQGQTNFKAVVVGNGYTDYYATPQPNDIFKLTAPKK